MITAVKKTFLKGIQTIFISNVLEGFYQSYQGLPAEERDYWMFYDPLEGNRALFYNGDRKVVLTSYPINSEHIKDVSNLMEWKSVVNLSPKKPSPSLCKDIMNVEGFGAQIELIIKENPGIELIPYRATPEFYRLVSSLNRKGLNFTTPETMAPEQEFVTSYCHCKRGFRHLWSKAFPNNSSLEISIPLGFITGNKEEAIEAAWWFRRQNRSFVIKYNRGVQGIGVMFNHHSNLPEGKKTFFEYLQGQMTDQIWQEPSIIVEEMINIDKNKLGGSPSVEFFINKNGEVIPSYGCEQILGDDRKTFRGVYIHPEVVTHKHIQTAFKAGKYFGKELAGLGYRGYFDIDLVISKEDKVYAVESNMRRTGGTHLHEAALSLLGKNYWQTFHIIGEDIILPKETKTSYEECSEILADLHYKQDIKTGFLFGNPDMLKVNIAHTFIFARSTEEIKNLRSLVHRRLHKAFFTNKTTDKNNQRATDEALFQKKAFGYQKESQRNKIAIST